MESLKKLLRISRIYVMPVLVLLYLNGCGFTQLTWFSEPEDEVNSFTIKGRQVALLEFQNRGYNLPTSIKTYSTNYFAELLSRKGDCKINGPYKVLVNYDDPRSGEIENIIAGTKLPGQTELIVFGELYQTMDSQFFDPDAERRLKVTIRLIDKASGTTLFYNSMSENFDTELYSVLDELLEELAESVL